MAKTTILLILFFSMISARGMGVEESDFLWQVQHIKNMDYSSGSTGERANRFKKYFLKIHHFTYNYGSKLLFQLNDGKILNGHELNLIHETLSSYLLVSKKLNSFLKEFSPKSRSSFLRAEDAVRTANELHWLELKSLLLFHYKNTFQVFLGETTLRRIVKNQMNRESYGLGDLKEVTNSILSKKFKRNLEIGIEEFLERENKIFKLKNDKLDEISNDLKSTMVYKLILDGDGIDQLADQSGLIRNVGDSLNNVLGSVANTLSYSFGSVAGNISWREGYLKDDDKAHSHIQSNLRPLDLLLEKRGFVFTDFTIPGNWGHVAVYLGTEAELRDIDMWDHPSITPFHDKIKSGLTIYQVRRWGLEFVSLKDFMNLDEIAIIRHENILKRNDKLLGLVYRNLFDQIGKKYDFGFDAMSTNEITCTEIIGLSYGDINWPSSVALGRVTISPDNMAQIALYSDSPVKFVTYIKATDWDKVNYKEVKGFARVMKYRTKLNLDGSLRFDQYSRKCRPIRYRNQGGLRLKRTCETQWLHHQYQ